MPKYSPFHTKIWNDYKFRQLPPEGKLLFIYLFGNDAVSLSGIYEIDLDLMRFHVGVDGDIFKGAMEAVMGTGNIRYDSEKRLVWIVNSFKYQSKSPQVIKGVISELNNLPDHDYKRLFVEKYGPYLIGYTDRMDSVCIGHLKKEIKNYKERTTEQEGKTVNNSVEIYLNQENIKNLRNLFRDDESIKKHLLGLGFTEHQINEALGKK